MSCKTICSLCKHLILSTYVSWDATNGRVVIGLPAGTYYQGEKYCIVVAQPIPATATINAPVVVSIGSSATPYSVVNCDCTPLTSCGVRSRTKYSTCLTTTGAGATFRMLGKVCRCCQQSGGSISG